MFNITTIQQYPHKDMNKTVRFKVNSNNRKAKNELIQIELGFRTLTSFGARAAF